MAQDNRFKNFTSHFSDGISDDLKAFVVDQALVFSRYLFVRRITSTIQRGFCTHCQSDYVITAKKALKHNESWQCEKCKSLVLVKQSGRGRGKLFDKAYVIWYEKSKTNPEAIVATGYNVSKDYRDNFKGETYFDPVARYVFEPGKATMMHRNHYYTGIFGNRAIHFEDGWRFAKDPFTMIGKSSYTGNSLQSLESVHAAVKGTSFMYSEWSQFADNNQDLIFFFKTFSRYPFIEYLLKFGMQKIVEAMVEKRELYKSINLRGKTMEKILGLSKKELMDWKSSGVEMTPVVLYTYKWFRTNDVHVSWDFAKKCDYLIDGSYYRDKLNFINSLLPLERIIKYVKSQMNKDPKHFQSVTFAIATWNDYLQECQELKMNLSQEKVLLPNSLRQAHEKTTRAIKVKKDKTINLKIERMQPNLKKYWFEDGELMIRPAASSIEMFDEGKQLDHCVGRYADRYAKGEIAIMFIRKKSEPEKSFYTLELYLKTNEIVQCRGLKNCNTTTEVESFIKAFTAEKLSKKSKRNNQNIQARQEVAV